MEKDLFRSNEGKKVTLVGFWVNALLSAFKIIAGIIGSSSAMLADGIHSLSDFLTDIVVIIGLKLTEKPEDDCHNYGHDKYETLATVVISIFLAVVGFNILRIGIIHIIDEINGFSIAKPKWIALIAAFVSITFKELLYRYTALVGERINSPAVIANAWHHRSDALSSICTFIGIGGAIVLGSKWTILDPIASILVSFLIFKVAIDILIPAINELMEASLCKEDIIIIKATIEKCSDIKSFHKLRTRKIGTKNAVEFHALVNPDMDITAAHDIATTLENQIKNALGGDSIVTIHIEPYCDEELNA